MLDLHAVGTPALLLDHTILLRNIERMRSHLAGLGVPLRPHFKTAKSLDVIRLALDRQPGAVAVSTLEEADACVVGGLTDILYAVGLASAKVGAIALLVQRGAAITCILDSVAAARAAGEAAAAHGVTLPILVELDVDGHRAGVAPGGQALLEVAGAVRAQPALQLKGVLTHAGESYACRGSAALMAMAEQERAGALLAARRLREAGFPMDVVSVGSTPTATFGQSFEGVTEVRAGVYLFNDLMMAGLGVCTEDDIAISVLVTVIGHQPDRGWVLTDGGWTALSRDRSTAALPVDQAYGVVRSASGERLADDLLVTRVSQEHGTLARRDGGSIDPARYPIGTRLRVLPNHACATADQFEGYWVLPGSPGPAWWPRASRSAVRSVARAAMQKG